VDEAASVSFGGVLDATAGQTDKIDGKCARGKRSIMVGLSKTGGSIGMATFESQSGTGTKKELPLVTGA